MKKSLIAMAVLAASGAAMAQSSVTVYGGLDVSIANEKNSTQAGSQGSVAKLNNGGSGFNTSKIGFKGTEDLGGGLKANFQIETTVSNDAPAATSLGDRQAWVGVSGGFGAIQLGRVWNPYDDARATANDTFNANFASSFNVWRGYQDRTTNGLRYDTPTIAGFTGSVAYSFGEDKTATAKASNQTSFNLNYSNGPIVANLAHQIDKDNNVGAGLFNDLSDLRPAGGTGAGKTTYTLINGSYDLGVAKLIAGYNTVKATAVGVAGSNKANEWNLGVEVPFGANLSAAAGYAQSKVKESGVESEKTKGYSLAVKYALSKRTFTYVGATNEKTTFPGSTDFDKTTKYFVGMQHNF